MASHSTTSSTLFNLQLSRLDNSWLVVVLNLARSGSGSLKSLDDIQGLLISDLAEDDVLTIEPAGDNGGDEKLRAVAESLLVRVQERGKRKC